MIHVAVGIVLNKQGEILLAERAQHKYQGGMWEFPGGKVEEGETVLAALARELQEEINIHIVKAIPLLQYPYQYSDKRLLLDTWLITDYEGEAQGQEGQPILWVTPDQLATMEIPEGNVVIVKTLLEYLHRS